jgi:Sec7-like guanine-nucleotide exchange factor
MLNTDAHNPNVKPEKKMTKNGFISNNRGIAAGQDVDRQLLCDIYDEIVAHPITLKEDDKLRELKQVPPGT